MRSRQHAPMTANTLSILWISLGLLVACNECQRAEAIQTTVVAYAPWPGLTPRYCLSEHEVSCREADEVEGLAHVFHFEQHAEGHLWCSYVNPPGSIRTSSCEDISLSLSAPIGSSSRELVAVVSRQSASTRTNASTAPTAIAATHDVAKECPATRLHARLAVASERHGAERYDFARRSANSSRERARGF